MKTIYLAGGCFWGTQKFLDQFTGVKKTEVGYANGRTENPSYEEVCMNNTGHAETVKVLYDETVLSTKSLLRYYFLTINPTSVNRQGNDVGTQYRTGIYYDAEGADQRADIDAVMAEVEEKVGQPLAVEVGPLENYYPAEMYHQKYLNKVPFGYCHIPRDLLKLNNEDTRKQHFWNR